MFQQQENVAASPDKNQDQEGRLESLYGIRYSPLCVLDYFDPIRMSSIDLMHNVYKGTAKMMIKVWNIKKLETRANKKDTGDIRPWIKSIVNHTYWVAASSGEDQNVKIHKWTSISNHIINKHVHESDLFQQCIHGELEEQRAWLKQGFRSHKLVLEVIESKYLLNDLKKRSPLHKTYGLEVFHSLVNQYAMKARIYIAALHYNENGNRQQAVTKAGILKSRTLKQTEESNVLSNRRKFKQPM
ncbi:unnamed protein product [Mytilus coruscus]|uniref:Uncharacterized protein n=1 Tax=Mytilus coruscus TaxID=42192 RepID=A0A6J8EU09_MYTCO|nr:unnamed protein product [Mytilus coruscus]